MITSCASTNRETVVEIVNPARKTKKIKLQLNYNISVFSRYLKVLTLKQSPDEPDYDIHQVIYQPKNSEAVQWTDENFPGFREELLASKKINLQVSGVPNTIVDAIANAVYSICRYMSRMPSA